MVVVLTEFWEIRIRQRSGWEEKNNNESLKRNYHKTKNKGEGDGQNVTTIKVNTQKTGREFALCLTYL